jgi:hypothetical protein
MMTTVAKSLAIVLALTAAAPAPRIVAAAGQWAALGGPAQCDAASLSLLPASKTRAQGRAAVSFDGARRHGQFVAALSKPTATGGVMLVIGDQPFLLVARGATAWSRGPLQEQAIIAAMRGGQRMRIEGRSVRGLRFIDRYDLAGAPTAIDAAAACAAGL